MSCPLSNARALRSHRMHSEQAQSNRSVSPQSISPVRKSKRNPRQSDWVCVCRAARYTLTEKWGNRRKILCKIFRCPMPMSAVARAFDRCMHYYLCFCSCAAHRTWYKLKHHHNNIQLNTTSSSYSRCNQWPVCNIHWFYVHIQHT